MSSHRRTASPRPTCGELIDRYWSPVATFLSILVTLLVLVVGPWAMSRNPHGTADHGCVVVQGGSPYQC